MPAKLPAIGVGSGGLEAANERRDLQDALEQLRPSHLHAVVEPQRTGWEPRLRAAAGFGFAVGVRRCSARWSSPNLISSSWSPKCWRRTIGRCSRLMLFDTKSSVTTTYHRVQHGDDWQKNMISQLLSSVVAAPISPNSTATSYPTS